LPLIKKGKFFLCLGDNIRKKQKGVLLLVNADKERQRTVIALSVIFWVLIIAFIVVFLFSVI